MKYILFIIISFFAFSAYSQTAEVDSLQNLLAEHTAEDTIRVNLLNENAHSLIVKKDVTAVQVAEEAFALADKLNYTKGLAKSANSLALYYGYKSNYPKALKYIKLSIGNYKSNGDIRNQAASLNYASKIYTNIGEFDEALNTQNEAIGIYQKVGDFEGSAKGLSSIGIIYFNKALYANALENFTQAYGICVKEDNKQGMARNLNAIGVVCYFQNELESAMKYYNEALNINEELDDEIGIANQYTNIGNLYDEWGEERKALEYHHKALELRKKTGEKKQISESLINVGLAYRGMYDYINAESYLNEALFLSRQLGAKQTLGKCMYNLAKVYLKQGRIKEAYDLSKKAYDIGTEMGNIRLLKKSTEVLSECCVQLGHYKDAYKYHVIFKVMTDSIFNESNIKEITNLKNQYEFNREKETIATEQAKKDAIQANEMKSQKQLINLFIGGFSLILILALIILRSFLQKHKDNKILAKQKSEIETINSKLIELDRFKQTMIGLIVHDLKNPLNTILSRESDGKIKQQARQMLNMVMNILDIQKFEDASMKIELHENFLVQSINNAVEQIILLAKEKNIVIENRINQHLTILTDPDLIERVLINLLANAVKYTPNNGKVILVANDEGEGYLRIHVEDTGTGIPKDKQHLIFEKFGQVEAKQLGYTRSTGLGLTFCKLAVEGHGVKIGVESDGKNGAVFWFTLKKVNGNPANGKIITVDSKFNTIDSSKVAAQIEALRQLRFYEVSKIRQVLAPLEKRDDIEIKNWRNEVLKAVANGNEIAFRRFIDG